MISQFKKIFLRSTRVSVGLILFLFFRGGGGEGVLPVELLHFFSCPLILLLPEYKIILNRKENIQEVQMASVV